ncbi:MAG: permease-like cell division protein FtsX [Deltaproteobacteria bacterium]|nr:permease-like cell division protein FtsX [Deltaproteobacteria bacterium]
MKAHLYLIISSFRRMQENPRQHFLAIFTITICFFLVGSGLMGFYQIKRSLNQMKHLQWVYVYIDTPLDQHQQSNFINQHCAKKWVDLCRYVSAEKAKKLFLGQYPDMKSSLQALGENPFPVSFEIRLAENLDDRDQLQDWLNQLKKINGVSEVDDGGQWLSQWIDLILFLDAMTYVLMILVGIMILGLVSNTIRLLMFSKKDEIGILQLVGATPSMIRTPLLLNAALYGLLGSMLALVFLYIGYLRLNHYISTNFSALLSHSFMFMSVFDQVLLVLIAIAVSVVGAWFSVERYLASKDIS